MWPDTARASVNLATCVLGEPAQTAENLVFVDCGSGGHFGSVDAEIERSSQVAFLLEAVR